MKPVFQTIIERGKGNCWNASLASVLEIPLETIPEYYADEDWLGQYNEWLKRFNVRLEYTEDVSGPLTGWMIAKTDSLHFPGRHHAIVGFDGRLVHDPNPLNAGKQQHDYKVHGWFLFRPVD